MTALLKLRIQRMLDEIRISANELQQRLHNSNIQARTQAMDKQQLHEKIELLRAELDQLECPDSNQRDILQKVASDVQDMLARQEELEHYGDLGERLKEAVAQIEASHPEAILRMRQVIDQLAYMGI